MVNIIGLLHEVNARPPAASYRVIFHKLAIHGLLTTDILFSSRLYRLLDLPIVQTSILSTVTVIVLIYTVLALLERRWINLSMQFGVVVLILFQTFRFGAVSMTDTVVNTAFQFVFLTSHVVFSIAISEGLSQYILRNALVYAKIYIVIYVIISCISITGMISQESIAPLEIVDPERGHRLFIYSSASAFVWFYYIRRLYYNVGLVSISILIISGLAVYLSFSRVYTLIVVIITFMHLAKFRKATIALFCFGLMLSSFLVLSYGLINNNWNPFSVFSADSSGNMRAIEYETARYFLLHYPLFGVGFPPTGAANADLTGSAFFAANDLGPFGVWFDWGLSGIVLLILCSIMICGRYQSESNPCEQAFSLTGLFIVGYSCIAVTMFYSSGATYLAIIVGLWSNWWTSENVRDNSTPLSIRNL